MKKILIVSIILLLLFFTPFYGYKKLETVDPKAENKTEAKVDLCPISITVEGIETPLPLEEYVAGVVSAEMPVSFHEQALQAQAIAARTYVLKTTNYGKTPIKASVTHQAFVTLEERKKNWGEEFEKNEKKVQEAVQQTAGQVLFFQDELITAMFFSTSNGKTESAKSFSGRDIPYLQSVASAGEEKISPRYETIKTMPLNEWNTAFKKQWTAAELKNIQLERNETGRVQTMKSGNSSWTGREVRSFLALTSTDFDITYNENKKEISIISKGNGHGVGMSQYGAEVFAQEGWSKDKILTYYYQNVSIKTLVKGEGKCLE